MTDPDALHGLADRFEADRPHLRAVAQRILGSPHEAEDAVQEAWVRLSRTDTSDVANLTGWLTTVVSRVCLDMLRSRAARREDPADLPETVAGESTDPEREALMADAIGPALLLVLDTLTPAERLAFVLHDMFAVPFPEIAEIVGCSPAAARQLASRARRRVQGQTAGSASPAGAQTSSSPTAPTAPHSTGKANPAAPQPAGKTNPPAPQPAGRTDPIGPQLTGKTDRTGTQASMGGSRPPGETVREASRPSTGDDTSAQRDVARRRTVVDAFLTASRSGDFAALLALLDPDVVLRADAAGVRTGAAGLVRGANAVAETFSGRARGARLALINGAPGLVWYVNNEPRVVFAFTIADEAIADVAMADPATTDEAIADPAATGRAATDGAVTVIELLADPETLATLHLELTP